jgi:hypothetical protein
MKLMTKRRVERQQERAWTRAMSRSKRGFVKSNVRGTMRAKADWLSRVGETLRKWSAHRRFLRNRARIHRQHQARMIRDPKYAAKCFRRSRDYERCLEGQNWRGKSTLCGWMRATS